MEGTPDAVIGRDCSILDHYEDTGDKKKED
jgi:hypothetical protein